MNYSPRSFFVLGLVLAVCGGLRAQDNDNRSRIITISTAQTALRLVVAGDGRVGQLDYGRADRPLTRRSASAENEFYPSAGNGYVMEPALQVVHADGNTSAELDYVSHETSGQGSDVVTTRIKLKDPAYPFFVTLGFRAYQASDVIEQWAEITHEEEKPVRLVRYASSAPVIKAEQYYLTQFFGTYMREAGLVEEKLAPGIKILDTKIGVRAHYYRNPSFLLSAGGPADETTGEVYGGTLAWSGNFQFAFDIDHTNRLRAVCGINPFGATYALERGKVFTTPGMLWTWSNRGKGQVSRNFHRWGRTYGVRDGSEPRPILLNNWEATNVKFDENIIVGLFDGAKEIGAELFLLDDGWFGNGKFARDNDRAGLGDWQEDKKKLPRGLSYLATEANNRGIGFGIWLEPEMVNPVSELFEKHPDWVMRQPKRELEAGRGSRNQAILDLTRPEVKQYAIKIIDDTLAPNPGISYVKWDANRYVTQPGSTYLAPDQQPHLLVDYQWALYDVMKHMATRYPKVKAMVCAGGSGRVDYGSLRYFHSFWPSDNTDPVQRVFIQWGFSHIFPANTISAHVTDMGHKPLKFAIDVAMTGAFGVDRDVRRWTAEERKTVAAASQLYRERVRDVVLQGDLYRLQSPYEKPQAALNYVSADKSRAIVFIFRLAEAQFEPVKPQGLDPAKKYRIREINLPEGRNSRLNNLNNSVVEGAALMEDGFTAPLRRANESAVIELVEEK